MELSSPLTLLEQSNIKNETQDRKRILIIEDDLCLQNALKRGARHFTSGNAVDWATTADEVQEGILSGKLALEQVYDLVVSDILLPGSMSGLDLLGFCRKNYFSNIPFLLISGMGLEAYLKVAKANENRVGFLAKPFSLSEYEAAIAGLLQKSHSER